MKNTDSKQELAEEVENRLEESELCYQSAYPPYELSINVNATWDELKQFLAQELSQAISKAEKNYVEREMRSMETVLMLLNGDDNQVDVLKTYAINKLEALQHK